MKKDGNEEKLIDILQLKTKNFLVTGACVVESAIFACQLRLHRQEMQCPKMFDILSIQLCYDHRNDNAPVGFDPETNRNKHDIISRDISNVQICVSAGR